MDIHHIRLVNLQQAIKKAGSQARLADMVGIKSAYISQIKNTKHPTNMGNDVARRIESALGLPHGWMDVLHDNEAMRVINEDDEAMLKLAKMMLPVATPHSNAHLQRIIDGLEQNRISDAEKKELEVMLKVIAERFFPKGAL